MCMNRSHTNSANHIDIHSILTVLCRGISNTAGTLAGVVGVAATGYMLQWAGGAENVDGWHRAFAAAAVQCGVGSVVFVWFARGERLFGGDTEAESEL
jgi:ACS family sodium-dependent inorganic phosphate cotransporter